MIGRETSLSQAELRFGRFRLQPMQRQLFEGDMPVKLRGRAFDVLCALVERRDRVVPKNELMQLAWPKRVVEENNLQVQVVALRKLLGLATIKTIPGRGYQFTGNLEASPHPELPRNAADAAQRDVEALRAPSSQLTCGPPTNLPADLQPLYGRAHELGELTALLAGHPLISVVGPGGIGKTRLALAAAHRVRTDFPDGVWVVELAPVTEPTLALSAIARALQLQRRNA